MRALVIYLLMLLATPQIGFSQPSYNSCNQALEICPNASYSLTNYNSNITFCPSCEDDFNFCFTPDNSIWLTFQTNATGGDISVDFTNLLFNNQPGQDTELQATIIEATIPCDAASYTQIGNCVSNATTNFSLTATGLAANTTYYIVIDGDNTGAGITSPAEATFDLSISGTGIDRPISTIAVDEPASTICPNEEITFTATITDCPDNGDYLWYVNGQLVATTAVNSFSTNELTNGDVVTVETTCYTTCIDTIDISTSPISVFDIQVNAGNDLTVPLGETVQLFGSTNASTYYWTPEFLVSDAYILNPLTTPTQTTVYELTVEENGCVLTDYVTITIEDQIVIPTTFSPNGDDINELWIIKGLENYPDNKLSIYTRWGQPVFQTVSYSESKAWDGSNNQNLLESVYFYVLDLNGDGETIYKGTITVIR